jgi:hypothetical protein
MENRATSLARPMLGRLPSPVLRTLRTAVVRRRHRGLRQADVLCPVYPKSGSTRLRFVLNTAMTAKECSWDELRTVPPPLGRQGSAPAIVPGGGRLIKTHDYSLKRMHASLDEDLRTDAAATFRELFESL